MSKMPAPVARSLDTANGRAASVPTGQTVSKCPSSATRGSPNVHRRCTRPSRSIQAGASPSSALPMSSRTRAHRRQASMSLDGDSAATSRWSDVSIVSRSAAKRSIAEMAPIGCTRLRYARQATTRLASCTTRAATGGSVARSLICEGAVRLAVRGRVEPHLSCVLRGARQRASAGRPIRQRRPGNHGNADPPDHDTAATAHRRRR